MSTPTPSNNPQWQPYPGQPNPGQVAQPYSGQVYQQPYAAAPAPRRSNGMAAASVILAIIAVIFAVIPLVGIIIAAPCALLGFIFGIIGLVRYGSTHKGLGQSITGVVLAVLAAIMMSVGGGLIW